MTKQRGVVELGATTRKDGSVEIDYADSVTCRPHLTTGDHDVTCSNYGCPFAGIFIRSLIDATVSLAENGHFDVVL